MGRVLDWFGKRADPVDSDPSAETRQAGDVCLCCGRPRDTHDRHARFRLPDPVLDTRRQHRVRGAWLSHANPDVSVMMHIPGVGAFLRALLPVRLTGDFSATFGVWVAVDPADLKRASAVWSEPEYRDLRLRGRLANALPVWGLLSAPVELAVRDPEQTPYCVSSSDPGLARVLAEVWPHEDVLPGLP
ncbi:DUF2199 domain-containing protein [Actinoplanes teichomyceticus]|uniref:Uncharacterized protein DUF2199 n=1 Tax=Actinoplanes teichomyceticus TaxID=1867 RepID=A0A561WRW9_ACTTI|nr:DUF2199 domain-containing protein [Actinoplanes teichomyceticus]TWG26608.1 uncharacterized protein DUF2199 [Actinoplanes teichomyceticus]GIF17177.1 hypothetical protein Ate01nite_72090 [Actinoplanes teichomyceticus]